MNLPYSLENSTSRILTVSELNRNTKQLLEQNIPLLWVQGEISNLKRYPSGHWYFSLKDSAAQIRCVFFNHKNYAIDWQLKDGMHIEALFMSLAGIINSISKPCVKQVWENYMKHLNG